MQIVILSCIDLYSDINSISVVLTGSKRGWLKMHLSLCVGPYVKRRAALSVYFLMRFDVDTSRKAMLIFKEVCDSNFSSGQV